jgi:anti-sigma B factor antagonist
MTSVRVERDSGECVVVVSGDADLTTSDALTAALEECAADGTRVVVDLAATTLLDSRTIGVLLTWAERLRGRDGSLCIAAANPDVRRLFTTIGLDREFEFFDERPEAAAGT